MHIVPIDQIPKDITITPINNLSELYSVAQKMEKICKQNDGIGLSAVQVGIPWKFFIYFNSDKQKFEYMVDCDYEPINDNKFLSIEGCLSLRNLNKEIRRFKLNRYENIKVFGKKFLVEDKLLITDYQAELKKSIESTVIQHEIDHHKGILISDVGEEVYIRDVF